MSGTAGKVALVRTTTALSGACPTSADIVDLVGYGGANCFEGSGPTPPLSNTTAALRLDDGATDTDDNAADFVIGVPNPRPSKEPAPAVASTFPANTATGVATWTTLTVNFSEPVNVTGDWFTLVCATSGTHAVTVAGANTTFLLDPTVDFTGGESCTLTVVAANVTDQDADDPPDAMAADHVVTFSVASDVTCGAPATPIHDVQGAGLASPITGQVVEIEGVVVGAYPGANGFQGFHVQEEDVDADGDPATSEGLFIFEPNGGATYAVGDQVRVRGRVTEFTTTGVTLTELTNLNNLEVVRDWSRHHPERRDDAVHVHDRSGALRGHARHDRPGPDGHRDLHPRSLRRGRRSRSGRPSDHPDRRRRARKPRLHGAREPQPPKPYRPR